VGVLGDLPDQRFTVLIRHPVARLHLLIRLDDGVEVRSLTVSRFGVTGRSLAEGELGRLDLSQEVRDVVAVHLPSVTARRWLGQHV
jgi:hypothetical protein